MSSKFISLIHVNWANTGKAVSVVHTLRAHCLTQQLFIRCLYIPAPILAARDTEISKTDINPCPHGAYILIDGVS